MNPVPTVDIIIEMGDGRIILIERGNKPLGWAIPGGYVDYGESLEGAAIREAREEVGIDVELKRQFHTYSDPQRDPRGHTISTVFVASGRGVPKAGDDAAGLILCTKAELPDDIVFDHRQILEDYFSRKY